MPPSDHAAPLSILHLSTAADRVAGAERLLEGIARLADRTRWSLRFVFLQPAGDFSRALEREGWPVETLEIDGPASAARGILRLERVLVETAPDVLHAHLFHGSLVGALAALPLRWRGGPRLVQSRHYSDYHALFASRARYALDRWVARRCDGIIAVSEAARDQLVRNEGVRSERVVVVENGVDLAGLEAIDAAAGLRALAAAGVPAGAPLVACAATFREQKGHGYLVQAWSRVHAQRPDAHLLLLGKGLLEQQVRSAVQAAGLDGVVHFLGHREDALAIVRASDVYVQPSVEEGFGLAVVEAMAMRRPVVACAVGGMLRTIVDGESGVHVPARDEAALAAAIVALLDEPERRARLGEAAARRARSEFSLARMVQDYDAFYRRVLGAPVSSGRAEE